MWVKVLPKRLLIRNSFLHLSWVNIFPLQNKWCPPNTSIHTRIRFVQSQQQNGLLPLCVNRQQVSLTYWPDLQTYFPGQQCALKLPVLVLIAVDGFINRLCANLAPQLDMYGMEMKWCTIQAFKNKTALLQTLHLPKWVYSFYKLLGLLI